MKNMKQKKLDSQQKSNNFDANNIPSLITNTHLIPRKEILRKWESILEIKPNILTFRAHR